MFVGEVKDGVLHIGSTSYPVSDSRQAAALVPNVLFYDNQLVSSSCHHHGIMLCFFFFTNKQAFLYILFILIITCIIIK